MRREKPTAVFEVAPRRPAPSRAARAAALEALGETWVPSRFNVAVALSGGETAVYNTSSGAVALLPSGAWQRWLEPGRELPASDRAAQDAARELRAKGLLVPKGVDEVEAVRLHYLSARHSRDVLAVNLLPTLACNLRCPYCFEGKVQATAARKTMSRETEEAVAAHVAASLRGRKALNVCWFGGEPLLALGAVERISARLLAACREARVSYSSTVVTNATLLRRDVVARLRRWRVTAAQVTVDVPKAAKRDRRGRDTLEPVLDNLRVAARRLEVHLRINLSADHEAEFDQLYAALMRRGLHERLKAIMIAHVVAPECGRTGCRVRPVPPAAYVDAIAREYRKARALGLPLKRYFASGPSGGCTATCESSMAIGPDGLLYKCVEDVGLHERAYGSVFLKGHVKLANLLPWLTYDWFQHAQCRDCVLLPQCAGGCPHRRLFEAEGRRDEDFCDWNVRGHLEDRIRDYALARLGTRPRGAEPQKE